MEDTHEEIGCMMDKKNFGVLILIVMEDTHEETDDKVKGYMAVLILIVMEDTHEVLLILLKSY